MEVNRIYNENCLETLRRMPDDFLDACVSSPPYYGLRDYGVDEQIGLEETPQLFIDRLVEVFEEVRRVLKPDGTCWINIGDSYASSWPCNRRSTIGAGSLENGKREARPPRMGWNLKEKDLMMMPARVAIALQDAGWWLRQDIIWAKPNPMPEPANDRCVKAHEYIFLLTKSARYYFDAYAIATKYQDKTLTTFGCEARGYGDGSGLIKSENGARDVKVRKPKEWSTDTTRDHSLKRNRNGVTGSLDDAANSGKANKRSVWTVTTQSFKEAHFATFPEKLIEPCILAGCPTGGIVYDPFMGSGTTAVVAHKLGRNWIGSELNPEYVELANKRLEPYLNQPSLI